MATKTYDELVIMLEPYKSTEYEALRRPPATSEAITKAERLGIKLPKDYKSFLKITNAMNLVPHLSDVVGAMPSLCGVEDLEWKLGLLELLEQKEFDDDLDREKGKRGRTLTLSKVTARSRCGI